MRIDLTFTDRVGIAHEILAVLARRRLNVVAVEVDPPHLYLDAPELTARSLPPLRTALLDVAGLRDITEVDLLPGTRRRLHLDAVLAAMVDPVFAVDGNGVILLANDAAAAVTGATTEAELAGLSLGDLFANRTLQQDIIAGHFRMPLREVMVQGEPFLLDIRPITEPTGGIRPPAAGGVVMLHAPSRLGERLHALQNYDEGGFEKILGDSAPMRELKARAVRVAAVDAPLLILGETGTGKELIAHACHRASSRQGKPFLALNCAALPENLAESELFGYAPGAFTGAQRGGKPGLLELASQGTVFLDEIGEMSPYLQAKLLRFLNDGSFRRVGGDRELKVDVRIISATHRRLEQMVLERTFREDLFYRLNVLTLQVPPLRERGNDILMLARHFIERACAQARRPLCRLTATAGAALLATPWPGNVRQLESVIFRAVTMSDGALLDVGDLELASSRRTGDAAPLRGACAASRADSGCAATARGLPDHGGTWEETLEDFERALLRRLFPHFPSSRKLAARLKTSHTMIANKLRKYGIPQTR